MTSLVRSLSLCCGILLLFGCQETLWQERPADEGYFPLQTRQYRIYAVAEQTYRPGQPALTRKYELKETTGKPFVTLAGDSAYVVTFAHRTPAGETWQIDSMGVLQRTFSECRSTTGGQTVVRLAFPIIDGQRWNGNRLNNRGLDEFQLQHCHQPFRSEGNTFARTVTVVQQNDSTLVSQGKRLDVFAYQVGLVYAERQQVRFCATSPGCGQPAAIVYGTKQFIRLTNYGTE